MRSINTSQKGWALRSRIWPTSGAAATLSHCTPRRGHECRTVSCTNAVDARCSRTHKETGAQSLFASHCCKPHLAPCGSALLPAAAAAGRTLHLAPGVRRHMLRCAVLPSNHLRAAAVFLTILLGPTTDPAGYPRTCRCGAVRQRAAGSWSCGRPLAAAAAPLGMPPCHLAYLPRAGHQWSQCEKRGHVWTGSCRKGNQ